MVHLRHIACLQRFFLPLLLCIFSAGACALEAGDHDVRLRVSGLDRHYVVVVPKVTSRTPLPAVVLNFHGAGANAREQQKYSRMDLAAAREGFIAVYPDGTGPVRDRFLTWNAGACCGSAQAAQVDDVAFVRALLDDLEKRIAYDRARVYATGLSNGAMMSYRLAAEMADRIAAIAPVAGAMVLSRIAPSRPVPVLHIHSVDDGRALYEGGLAAPFAAMLGNSRVLHPPVEEKLAEWARVNGCSGALVPGERREWKVSTEGSLHAALRLGYTGCKAETALWKLSGAGHVWPGGILDYLPWLLGPGTRVIDASEEAWRFFSRHRMPQ
jgi:polyhydroxybutyrate depolymerase